MCRTPTELPQPEISLAACSVSGAYGSLVVFGTLFRACLAHESSVTLANAQLCLPDLFDEAFTMARTDLTAEHRTLHMACLADIRILAITPSLVGKGSVVPHTHTTLNSTTRQITVLVHWTTVRAGLAHVRLVAVASGRAFLCVECTLAMIGTWDTLGHSWAHD